MIGVLLLVLAQPAPPPTTVVWTSDGGSVAARVGASTVAVVKGISIAPIALPVASNQVAVSTSTTSSVWRDVPDCDGATKALNFRTASGLFACNTFSTGSGYATVMDEGSALTQRATVNFVGAVTCVDNSGASRTDCTVSGGSSNVAEVTVAFGAGATTASTVVTGQAWVTATSKILCVPVLLAASGRNEGAEDPLIEGLAGAAHTRVLGTGFTLTAGKTSPGLYYGSQIFHCTGS